jgi:hypothetical protein
MNRKIERNGILVRIKILEPIEFRSVLDLVQDRTIRKNS